MSTQSEMEQPWGAFPLSTSQALLLGLYRVMPIGRSKLRTATLVSLHADEHPSYDIEVAGIRTRCHLGDNASERKLLLNGARKDRTQLRLILDNLPRGGTFVDVGANVGLYSLRAAKAVGAEGQVLAIEPNREMAERLRFNVESNRLQHVKIAETAIGPCSGEATLTFDKSCKGAGTLATPIAGEAQTVPVVPLALLLSENAIDHVDALKIDVEGYEDRALLPLFETAPRSLWPRMILMEVSWRRRWETDCVAKLLASGYQVIWKGRDDLALRLGAD